MLGDESVFVSVNTQDEADLVIFSEVGQINGFSKNKSYAFLATPGQSSQELPEDCLTINVLQIFPGLAGAISKTREKITPKE